MLMAQKKLTNYYKNLKMKFKGSKGKLKVNTSTKFSDTLYVSSLKGSPTFEENEYNALLFEKAPEMLEMLKILIQDIEEEGNYSRQTGYDLEEAKQLIKSATEI